MTPELDLVGRLRRLYLHPEKAVPFTSNHVDRLVHYGSIPSKVTDYIERNPEKKVSVGLLNDAFRLMEGVDLKSQGNFTNAILRILRREENYVAILSNLLEEDIRKNGSIKIAKIKARLSSSQMRNVHFIN